MVTSLLKANTYMHNMIILHAPCKMAWTPYKKNLGCSMMSSNSIENWRKGPIYYVQLHSSHINGKGQLNGNDTSMTTQASAICCTGLSFLVLAVRTVRLFRDTMVSNGSGAQNFQRWSRVATSTISIKFPQLKMQAKSKYVLFIRFYGVQGLLISL